MGGWYSMNKKGDNKIGIPWYKRNVQFDGGDDMGDINPISFDLDLDRKRNRNRQRQRQRVRETVPQTQTETQPSTATQPQTDIGTNPYTNPASNPFNVPFPLPPLPPLPPIPGRNRNGNPAPAPAPKPAFPLGIPAFISDPNFNWAKHFEEISKGLPKAAPEPPKLSPAQKIAQNIITPILGLFVAQKIASDYVKVNVTDPIYNQMLKDPVLGTVLREAEKANLDAETTGAILANFDWENGNYKELEKQLAVGVGVAGAARLMVFIIGRKVLFRV